MVTLKIRNLDIEFLLSFLRDTYSNIFDRVWECGNMTNAVLVASELAYRTFSEQTITIVVQHYLDNNECEITAIAAGGGIGLLRIDWGSQSAAEDTFVKKMVDCAKTQGWDLVRKHHGRKGSGCPHCGAYYQYTEKHLQDDGTVVCQNCLKQFLLEVGVTIGLREEKLA